MLNGGSRIQSLQPILITSKLIAEGANTVWLRLYWSVGKMQNQTGIREAEQQHINGAHKRFDRCALKLFNAWRA